jgi:hypothetical protein
MIVTNKNLQLSACNEETEMAQLVKRRNDVTVTIFEGERNEVYVQRYKVFQRLQYSALSSFFRDL